MHTASVFAAVSSVHLPQVVWYLRAQSVSCAEVDTVVGVFDPSASDKSKYGLTRVSLYSLSNGTQVLKVTGRPQEVSTRSCLVRSLVSSQVKGKATAFLQYLDYGLVFHYRIKGKEFMLSPNLCCRVLQLYKVIWLRVWV